MDPKGGATHVAVWAVAAVSVALATATAHADPVQYIVDQVDQSSYTTYLQTDLCAWAGDNRGFTEDGSPEVPMPDHETVRQNIYDLFVALGLEANYDPFTCTGGFDGKTYEGCNNVVGVLPGFVQTDEIYIVGAHYDSANTPGAHDNATGAAGLMEAARILSDYAFQATIVFIAFDAEEVGAKGSEHYANAAVARGDDIRGMVAMDMIGWNNSAYGNQNKVKLFGTDPCNPKIPGNPVTDGLAAAVSDYGDGLTAVVLGRMSGSDHAMFATAGYNSALAIEHDYYIYTAGHEYHSANDCLELAEIDPNFATRITRSVVGYLAGAARPLQLGDADLDGTVSIYDLIKLQTNFGSAGANWEMGDFDRDTIVGLYDLIRLQAHYGESLPGGGGAGGSGGQGGSPVPEPTVLAAMAISGVAGLRRRRR